MERHQPRRARRQTGRRSASSLAHELAKDRPSRTRRTKAIVVARRYPTAYEATDEAMRELQQAIWRSKDLEAWGWRRWPANGPGAARFEGR